MAKRARSTRPAGCPYVGKGGLKLEFALDRFGVQVAGKTAADLGCSVGGFTDCLLRRGAARVYAVDTGYGILAWTLRNDPRVVVAERTNILYWDPPEKADIIVMDLGWTPQARSLPVAGRMLAPGGRILSLVKPQYEADKSLLVHGVLPEEHLAPVLATARESIPEALSLLDEALSPIKGSGGNVEGWFLLGHRDGG